MARCGTSAAGPNDAVGAIAVDLLRTELQSKLLAHHPCKKTANGMLLPASRLHDRRNGGTRRSLEHRKHSGLLRCGGKFLFRVCGGSGFCWLCGLVGGPTQNYGVSRATVRTLGHGDPSFGYQRRLAPPPPKPHLGLRAGGAGSRSALPLGHSHSTAPFAREGQSCLDNLIAGWGQS